MKEYAKVRRNGLIAIKLQHDDELNWVAPTRGGDTGTISRRLGTASRFRGAE